MTQETEGSARVAMITGAARGIGAAAARELSARGWDVALVDVAQDIDEVSYALGTPEELAAVAAECGDAATYVADVRDQAALDAVAEDLVARYGGIDAVVASAGVICGGAASWELDEATWTTCVDITMNGVWRTAKAAVPAMLRRPRPRHGRFVAVASAAGMRGNPTIADYTAAKHGVVGFVRSLALELAPHEITVNAVAPGSTDTGILAASAAVYDLGSVHEFAVHHPIGRILDPSEIASGIGWLCEESSSGVTGVVLPIDGGMAL